jgi:hypothetical protein
MGGRCVERVGYGRTPPEERWRWLRHDDKVRSN